MVIKVLTSTLIDFTRLFLWYLYFWFHYQLWVALFFFWKIVSWLWMVSGVRVILVVAVAGDRRGCVDVDVVRLRRQVMEDINLNRLKQFCLVWPEVSSRHEDEIHGQSLTKGQNQPRTRLKIGLKTAKIFIWEECSNAESANLLACDRIFNLHRWPDYIFSMEKVWWNEVGRGKHRFV